MLALYCASGAEAYMRVTARSVQMARQGLNRLPHAADIGQFVQIVYKLLLLAQHCLWLLLVQIEHQYGLRWKVLGKGLKRPHAAAHGKHQARVT